MAKDFHNKPFDEETILKLEIFRGYIREQCLTQNVPFFFKQWGGTNKKKAGKLLDGRIWNEMPVDFKDKMYV